MRLSTPYVTLLLPLLLVVACAPSTPPVPTSDEPAPTPQPAGPPLFQDVTASSGVDFAYRNGEETADHFAILESLGGGVGLIDFDGDGRLDLYVVGGGTYSGSDKKQIVGLPGRLYRNLGGLKFRDVTADAGLSTLGSGKPWFYSHGVAIADYDRDGWPDLLVTGWGSVALFRNVPVDPAYPRTGRRFEDVTATVGLGGGITWATSAAFADLDGDGYADLYVCQYVDWSWDKHPKCSYDGTTPDVCPPKHFEGLTHKLYRNTGRGSFVEIGTAAGLKPGGPVASKGLGVLVVDVNGDARPDVYVANDTVENFLYVNESLPGRVRLDERGMLSNAARGEGGAANGSMGVDAGDPFRTGQPSLWVTNYENELHALYEYKGSGDKAGFHFRSISAGVAAMGRKYVGWGTAFVDADLDGWEDLFVAHGHAVRYPTGKDAARKQSPMLLLNEVGRFRPAPERIGEYARTPRPARGVAVGDLDDDGRPDIVVSHVNEPVAILRGVGGTGRHWLGVEVIGDDNACVVGARAVFEGPSGRQTRFVKGGGSYASSPDRRLLFGLGADETGRLTVIWPGGRTRSYDGVKVDQYYRAIPAAEVLAAIPGPTN